MALELERQFGPVERIQAVMRPNRSWTFKKFMKADLSGAITILVEDGSTMPKTALGKRAAIEHGRQLGVLNPADPEQQYSVMQEIGIAHLAPSLDAGVKAALREQTLCEAWVDSLPPPLPGQPQQLVSPQARMAVQPVPVTTEQPVAPPPGEKPEPGAPQQTAPVTQMVAPPPGQQAAMLFPGNPLKVRPWDRHMAHVVQHDIYCTSDEALETFGQFPELEELWSLHRQEHLMAAGQEAMQQMMAHGAMPPPGGPGGGPGAGMAMQNSNQNSGALPPIPAPSPQQGSAAA
jgi:hypothetical protein